MDWEIKTAAYQVYSAMTKTDPGFSEIQALTFGVSASNLNTCLAYFILDGNTVFEYGALAILAFAKFKNFKLSIEDKYFDPLLKTLQASKFSGRFLNYYFPEMPMNPESSDQEYVEEELLFKKLNGIQNVFGSGLEANFTVAREIQIILKYFFPSCRGFKIGGKQSSSKVQLFLLMEMILDQLREESKLPIVKITQNAIFMQSGFLSFNMNQLPQDSYSEKYQNGIFIRTYDISPTKILLYNDCCYLLVTNSKDGKVTLCENWTYDELANGESHPWQKIISIDENLNIIFNCVY